MSRAFRRAGERITEALCGFGDQQEPGSGADRQLDAEIAEWRMRPLTEPYRT